MGVASACPGWRYTFERRGCVYPNDAEEVRLEVKARRKPADINEGLRFIKQQQIKC
jgi:hypothetical protein